MADRFPLILNTSNNQIQEIASGDNLDLTGCNIVGATISGINTTGTTNLNNVSIAGVTTTSSNISVGSSIAVGTGVTVESNGQATFVGIVTAQKFVGDGSSLTGISGGVTVQDEGSALSTTATTLNFVGSGVVASGNGATKTITIAGGGGGGSGGALEFVSKTTVGSSVASVDFTNFADDSYYLLIGKKMLYSQNAFAKFKFLNTSNTVETGCIAYKRWLSSVLTYASGGDEINGYTGGSSTVGSFIMDISTKANLNSVYIRAFNPQSASGVLIFGSFDSSHTSLQLGGIRVLLSGGTIQSGSEFLLYKYKES